MQITTHVVHGGLARGSGEGEAGSAAAAAREGKDSPAPLAHEPDRPVAWGAPVTRPFLSRPPSEGESKNKWCYWYSGVIMTNTPERRHDTWDTHSAEQVHMECGGRKGRMLGPLARSGGRKE